MGRKPKRDSMSGKPPNEAKAKRQDERDARGSFERCALYPPFPPPTLAPNPTAALERRRDCRLVEKRAQQNKASAGKPKAMRQA